MLYLKSLVNVLDNSGAQIVECIKVLRKGPHTAARIGDKMVVVVKKARPIPANLTGQAAAQKVRKGDIRHAVLVRAKQPTQRPDGSIVRFDDNACVLLNQSSGDIVGTRVTGVVARELREKYPKLVTLAPRAV